MQIVFGTGIEVVAAAPAKATAVMRDPLKVFPAARRARLPGVRAGGPAAAAAAAAAASPAAAAVIGGAGGAGGAAAAGGGAAAAGGAVGTGAAGAAGGAAAGGAAAGADGTAGGALVAAAARPVIGAAGGAPSLRPAGFFGAAGALAAGALAADALLFDFFFFDFFFFFGVAALALTTGSGSTPPRRAMLRARRGVHLASASANKHASTRVQVACLILAKQRAGEDCLLLFFVNR